MRVLPSLFALLAALALALPAAPASAAVQPAVTADVCGSQGTWPPPPGSTRLLICYLNHVMNPVRWPPLPPTTPPGDPRIGQRVRVFQACAGLPVDGIVGPATWSALRWWANTGRVC